MDNENLKNEAIDLEPLEGVTGGVGSEKEECKNRRKSQYQLMMQKKKEDANAELDLEEIAGANGGVYYGGEIR